MALDEQSKLWRNFLDQLVKGGDTVTAVAAQRTAEHSIFWLASNSKARSKAGEHLSWVLNRLNEICTTDLPAARLEHDITSQCIDFSLSRIKTYTNWLTQAIRKAESNLKKDVNAEGTWLNE